MNYNSIILLLISILLFSNCKKDNLKGNCIDNKQQTTFLQNLSFMAEDTVQFKAAERAFLNEIRVIANNLEILTSNINTTVSIESTYQQILAKYLQQAALVEQKATQFYNGKPSKIILAKNAFVLMSYDALQRKYPEFMWTRLGIFAANEVRGGLVLALTLRHNLLKNNIHIPLNGQDVNEILLETCDVLIKGQLDVLTDIGSLGILNSLVDANKIKVETWLTSEAREGFRLQALAQKALSEGNCNSFYDLQTQAAIQFGAHEQIYILQPMWNQPTMQQFAALDQLIIQLTQHKLVFFGDIFIGTNKTTEATKGYFINIPTTVTDLSNASQRVEIAMNGFNKLNGLRKDKDWKSWLDYSQIKIGYFYDVYNAPEIE